MATWRPSSYSQQAREMCDRQIELVNAGVNTVEFALHYFSTSYRPEIIRIRAAKRFGRMYKKKGKKLPQEGGISMAKFVVVDWYENPTGDILGIDLSRNEAMKLADQRIEDTDGECDVQVYDDQIDRAIYSELCDQVYN